MAGSDGDEPISFEEFMHLTLEGDHPAPEAVIAFQKRIFELQEEVSRLLQAEAHNDSISPALAAHMMSLLRLEIRASQQSVDARLRELRKLLKQLASQIQKPD